MDPAIKWVGAATAAVGLFFASAAVTGTLLDSRADAQGQDAPRIESEDVLSDALAIPSDAPAAQPSAAPAEAAAPAAADQPFAIKRILPIDGPIRYGEWHWDEDGVPPGPLVITVDLEARVISVFRGGYEIGTAAVMIGSPDHPTPLGTFPILSKERYNVSEKYGDAPMPWTLRLTRDGVAIHGGAEVERGYASHGCIGSPDDFVAKLYSVAKVGDRVIITRGKTASVGDRLI